LCHPCHRYAVLVGQGYEQLHHNWAENVELRGGGGAVAPAQLSSPVDITLVTLPSQCLLFLALLASCTVHSDAFVLILHGVAARCIARLSPERIRTVILTVLACCRSSRFHTDPNQPTALTYPQGGSRADRGGNRGCASRVGPFVQRLHGVKTRKRRYAIE
jgi:hypothetical protein